MSARGEPGDWSYLVHWDGETANLDATLPGMACNDLDAAKLLRAERPGELHYVPPSSTWHVWDGHCHRPDDGGEIGMAVLDLADRYEYALTRCQQAVAAQVMAAFPAGQVDKETEARWLKWQPAVKYAAGLRKARGSADLKRMLADACPVPPAAMADRHPELLNCLTGTVDLRTGMIRGHDPADMITYCLPVAYRPELRWACPRFLDMVHLMTGRNDQVADFVMRVLGYCLLGENPERRVFFLNGPTSSGKTQVLYIVRQILGVLATESQADLITYCKSGRNARVENSIRGMRLITINETSARMHIEEGQLKRLTGEPEINVDQHYDKIRQPTRVTWTMISSTNDMPGVPLLDGAIRERMLVLPCGPTIPVQYRDKHLAEQILATEAGGILATLVYYAGLYFTDGLKPPADVEAATDYYCSHQNIAAQFAADLLETGRRWEDSIPAHMLWKACQGWGKDLAMPGRNSFYEMLEQLPGVWRDESGGHLVFRGIVWKQYLSVQYQ